MIRPVLKKPDLDKDVLKNYRPVANISFLAKVIDKDVAVQTFILESLTSGKFPSALKRSLIRPVLKKPDLDKDVLKNYRPVANISFLAKVIDKDVAVQTFILGG